MAAFVHTPCTLFGDQKQKQKQAKTDKQTSQKTKNENKQTKQTNRDMVNSLTQPLSDTE